MKRILAKAARYAMVLTIVLLIVGCTDPSPTAAPTSKTADSPIPTIATNMPQVSGNFLIIPRGTQGQYGTVRIGLSLTIEADYVDNSGVKQHGMTADVQLFAKDGPTESKTVYLGQTILFGGYTFFIREIRPTRMNPGDPPGTSGGGLVSLFIPERDKIPVIPSSKTPSPSTTIPLSKTPIPSTTTPPRTTTPSTRAIPAVYGNPLPLDAQKLNLGLTVGETVAIQLPAAGGMPPYSWTVWGNGTVPSGYKAGLPAGLSLDPGGYVIGTLVDKTPANYHFALMLQDSGGSSAVTEYNLIVGVVSTPTTSQGEGGPSIGGVLTIRPFEFSAAKAYGRFGNSGYLQRGLADFTSDQFIYMVPFVHGGTRPWNFIISGLPEGLTYNPSTGIIQGTLEKVKPRTAIEIKSFLKDAAGKVAYPETGRTFKFRVDYVDMAPVVNPPTTNSGTLSASGGAGNTLSLSGYGIIGTGAATVTVPAGSYTLTVTSATGAVLYQGTVRIDAGKVTTARISPW